MDPTTRYWDTIYLRRHQGVVYWWLPEKPPEARANAPTTPVPPLPEVSRNGTHPHGQEEDV